MNCSLKCDFHEYHPYSVVHVEVIQVIHWTSAVNLSYDRKDIFHARYNCWRHMKMMEFPEFMDATSFPVTSFSWSLHDSDSRNVPWFLTFICRGRFLCYFDHQPAKVCIFQPSLRTRRWVGFWFSSCPRVKFPCWCFECPRAFRRNRMVHGWGTCRDNWWQAQCQVYQHEPTKGHLRTICEQTVDNSPTEPIFFFELVVVKAWCCDFENVFRCFVCLFAISFHALLCMTFYVIGPWGNIRIRFPGNSSFFHGPSRNPGIEHIFVNVYNILAYLTFSLSTTKKKHGQGMLSVRPNQRLSRALFHIGLMFCFFPASFFYRPHTQIRTVIFLC